jgi:hypothetical protein
MLGDRRVLRRGDERGEVATKSVVHDVHPRLVVGTFGGVCLSGQGELLPLMRGAGFGVPRHGVSLGDR